MNNKKLRLMCLSGLWAAMVFVFTAYFHIPSHVGYTHIGDGFIYLSACIMPFPYAIFIGVGGAVLADVLSGFAIWAPATVIIKAAAVLLFSRKTKKIVCSRNLIVLIPAAIICTGGYYLYDALLIGSFASAVAGIMGYITQSVLSSILFIACALMFDKLKIKDKIR